ncbi:hypothetical protein ACFLYB_06165 [Chloroflexota bacterium]
MKRFVAIVLVVALALTFLMPVVGVSAAPVKIEVSGYNSAIPEPVPIFHDKEMRENPAGKRFTSYWLHVTWTGDITGDAIDTAKRVVTMTEGGGVHNNITGAFITVCNIGNSEVEASYNITAKKPGFDGTLVFSGVVIGGENLGYNVHGTLAITPSTGASMGYNGTLMFTP